MFSAGSLFAQDDGAAEIRRISLLPFWGEDNDMQYQFGRAVFNALTDMDGYQPFDVDMANRSSDVPDGGFPPYVAPHPSLTGDIPYGITGNVTFDTASNQWQLFLYLWQLDVMPQRLLWSDMSSYDDIESATFIMPFVLEALLAWIPSPEDADAAAAAAGAGGTQILFLDGSQSGMYMGEEWWYDWLYVGLRLGWNPQLFEPLFQANRNLLDIDAHWANFSVAASAYGQFLDWLGVQLDAVAMLDLGMTYHDNNTSSISVPLTIRYTHRRAASFFSVLAGAYMFLPFSPDSGEKEKGGQFYITPGLKLGYTAGFGIGNRAGPGNIFMEMRWSHDLFPSFKPEISGWTNGNYNRTTISVSVGYEMGFFKRKLGSKSASSTSQAASKDQTAQVEPDGQATEVAQ